MAEKIKKRFFKVLPWSVAVFLGFALILGIWAILPEEQVRAGVDITNPSVVSISIDLSDTLLTESDVGGSSFEVLVNYDEPMDNTVKPTIDYINPDPNVPTTSVQEGNCSGNWVETSPGSGIYQQYRFPCNVSDNDLEFSNIDITITGAQDLVGNPQNFYLSDDVFSVDMLDPTPTIRMPASGNTTRMATPLLVTTVEDGNCSYNLDSAGFVAMANTGGTIHTDNLVGVTPGIHNLDVSCIDANSNAGNALSNWMKRDPGATVLYGVDGAGANYGRLWKLNPETGAKVFPVGAGVGDYYVTGIAVDPTTGILYASTGAQDPGNDSDNTLLTINKTTGAATVVGKVWDGEVEHNLADISFNSLGQLYGWSEKDDNLYLVDKSTGAATFVGPSGLNTWGSGNDFDSMGNLYLLAGEGDLRSIDTSSGGWINSRVILNEPGWLCAYGAATFDSAGAGFGFAIALPRPPSEPADMFFATSNNCARPANTGELVVVDVVSGIYVPIGGDLPLMNAIAFDDTPHVTIISPPNGSTTNTTTLSVITSEDAMCQYELGGDDGGYALMSTTGGTNHSQILSIADGINMVNVRCTDIDGFVGFASSTWTKGAGGGGGGEAAPQTTVALTVPNGGESWAGNSSHNITWSSTGAGISKVKLFYSTDSGVNFPNTIAVDEANDGTYSWTVPNISSNKAKVKIDAYDSAGGFLVSDISDADFTITYVEPTVPPVAPPETPPGGGGGLSIGDLIKSSLSSTVYYYGSDNKRHVFPNEFTYKTWYADWSGIKVISDSQMQSISLGENVTIRPGTLLVKIETDPKVYAVEPGGLLRWVPSEARAATLYGPDWTERVIDVPLIFWGDYTFGEDITADKHPTGALIQYAGTTEIYYIQDAAKRLVTPVAFGNNRFQIANVLTVSAVLTYSNSTDITGPETSLLQIY